MIIIIDGYNLLRAVHFRAEGKLTREREEFIAQLGEYKVLKDHEIIVVFDAGPAMHATREIENGVVVQFSGQSSTADDWILEYVKREREKQKLLISRDRSLVDMCKEYGTEQFDPEVFYRRVLEVIAGVDFQEDEPRGRGIVRDKLKKKERKRAQILKKL